MKSWFLKDINAENVRNLKSLGVIRFENWGSAHCLPSIWILFSVKLSCCYFNSSNHRCSVFDINGRVCKRREEKAALAAASTWLAPSYSCWSLVIRSAYSSSVLPVFWLRERYCQPGGHNLRLVLMNRFDPKFLQCLRQECCKLRQNRLFLALPQQKISVFKFCWSSHLSITT